MNLFDPRSRCNPVFPTHLPQDLDRDPRAAIDNAHWHMNVSSSCLILSPSIATPSLPASEKAGQTLFARLRHGLNLLWPELPDLLVHTCAHQYPQQGPPQPKPNATELKILLQFEISTRGPKIIYKLRFQDTQIYMRQI